MTPSVSKSCLKSPDRWFALACMILILSLHILGVSSFQKTAFVPRLNVAFRALSRAGHQATKTGGETESSAPTLTFSGETYVESDTAPKASPEKILEFFQLEEARNYLISGGKQEVKVMSSTPYLMERWKVEALKMGAEEPATDDAILSVKTGGISFPGLTVVVTGCSGSKLLKPSDPTGYPEYQFTLIKDERSVTGAPPFVWIYNQLTGAGDMEDTDKQTSSHSLSRINVKEKGDKVCFTAMTNLEIDINFPTILFRILPVSKEKAEEQGSTAILKFLSKDVKASIVGFRDMYSKWISS